MFLGKLGLSFLVVLVGGAGVWLGMRRLSDLPASRRAGLAAFRGLAVVVTAAAVLNPAWLLRSTASRLSPVLVAGDHSASMDLADMDSGATRRAAVAARVLLPDGLLDRLASARRVEAYRFADQLLPLAGRSLPPAVDKTDLCVALRQLGAEALRARAQAIVLLSDGVDTEGLTAAGAARLVKGLPPILAVPVGGRARLLNRALLGLRAPRQTPAGKNFDCTVSASSLTEPGASLSLSWAASDGQSGGVSLKLGADGSGAVTFPIAAGRPGKLRVIVGISLQPGEYSEEDNARAAMVDVVAGDRRLIYLDSAPRPELASLRRLLGRLDEVKLSLGVRKATGEWSQELPSLKRIDRPSTLDSFLAATVYLLGDLSADAMAQSSWESIDRRVAGGEAALLILGGPDAVKMPGRLRDRLAAHPTAYQQRAVSLAAPQTTSPLYGPGIRWSDLPSLAGVDALAPLKPGAIVALRATDGTPLIVLRDDTVRSAIVATDSLSRLVFSASATDASREAYNHIWLKLLAWMLRPRPPRPITLFADRLVALAGDPLTVEGDATAAVDSATLEFAGPQPARRAMERRGPGMFRADLPGLPAGRHVLLARANAAGGRELGTDTLRIDVVAQSREWRHPGPYLPLLQAIADASGGRVVAWDDLDRLPDLLPRGVQPELASHRFAPARGILAAVLLLALILGDWIARRRWGLI